MDAGARQKCRKPGMYPFEKPTGGRSSGNGKGKSGGKTEEEWTRVVLGRTPMGARPHEGARNRRTRVLREGMNPGTGGHVGEMQAAGAARGREAET
jgi:hypothetical protein